MEVGILRGHARGLDHKGPHRLPHAIVVGAVAGRGLRVDPRAALRLVAGLRILPTHPVGCGVDVELDDETQPELIGQALLQAIGRVDFIIVTGGLGSTDDDITNEAVSQALNRPTMPDLAILAWIREHLSSRKISQHNPLEKLAWLPGGAQSLEPESRVAGYQLVHDNTPIFFLPGVPEEMKDLMDRIVLPKLMAWQEGSVLQTLQRIYKVFGLAESEINRRIKKSNLPPQIKIGYYPPTWVPNIVLSSILYFCAGMMWNLQRIEGRGVVFGFMEPGWPI